MVEDSDFMEIGDTGMVPLKNGWFYDTQKETYIDPDGKENSEQTYTSTIEG